MINVSNISFGYKKNELIYKDFNFKFEGRKCYAVIGHNGVGKTTLFRIMLGLIRIKKGEVIYTSDKKIVKKDIVYIPDFNGFFSGLTVYENIKFRIMFLGKKFDNREINQVLSKLKLEQYKNIVVSRLSAGLKKRVGLAAAVISKPKYLILDEPTNGLDPKSKEVIFSLLKDLKEKGVTIVFSSHDLEFVYRLADNFVLLNNGIIAKEGVCADYNKDEFIDEYFKCTEE